MGHAHGAESARGDYVGVIDGDGQFPVEAVIACLLKAEIENLDLTKTYRVRRDDGIYRRLISYMYNGLFKLLFGLHIHDVNSKPKIIRRDKYKLLDLQSDDWFADAEIMIRARETGLTIGEIPVHFSLNDMRSSCPTLFTVCARPGSAIEKRPSYRKLLAQLTP